MVVIDQLLWQVHVLECLIKNKKVKNVALEPKLILVIHSVGEEKKIIAKWNKLEKKNKNGLIIKIGFLRNLYKIKSMECMTMIIIDFF
jgi:hypothetical protein